MKRHAVLEAGKQYRNKNGDGLFYCRWANPHAETYELMNLNSRWVFTAHIITRYDDCRIEWDYSTGGHFE